MRFKFTIEYDGSGYSGWQKQKNSKSIQGTLIDTINEIFKNSKGKNELIDFQGSGRTDSGVHAYGQVAHLECITTIAPNELKDKLNHLLPGSISIISIEKADDRFHARHWAKSRQYIYQISKRRNVFEKKYSWWIKEKLDIDKITQASKYLIGMHDFIAFSEKPSEEKSTKVLIENIKIVETDDMILIKIKASHFLWKMVRRIVGILVEIGKGNIKVNNQDDIFKLSGLEVAKFTAPPSGLFLEKIYYQDKS